MTISVILCSHNGKDRLGDTLLALSKLAPFAQSSVEFILVDNASADGTLQLLTAFTPAGMRARVVREATPGLSHARNTALKVATGDILLFTDDDIIVPSDWLNAMVRPISESRADAVSCGVEMDARLEREWLTPRHRGALACTGRLWTGAPSEQITLLGASMAFSRRVLEKIPEFDPELGAGRLGCGEETLFSWQLHEAGFRVAFVDCIVQHRFAENRLLASNFVASSKASGRSSAYIVHHWSHQSITFPRLHLAWAVWKLSCRNLRQRGFRPAMQGCDEERMAVAEEISFYKQILLERARPRNYERRGLVRLDRASVDDSALNTRKPPAEAPRDEESQSLVESAARQGNAGGFTASIIICTRNRSAMLGATLDCIARLELPPTLRAELLIVDNGSTDSTSQIVESFHPENMAVRALFEPAEGIANARNCGLRAAKGDVVLFADDDVRLPRDWLHEMCAPIIRDKADAVAGGVTMAPHLERSWMTAGHRGYLACTGPLWTETPADRVILITASMALSKRVLSLVPQFDPGLDRGSDTLFSWQLAKAGFRLAFAGVTVEHHFAPQRLLRASLVEAARKRGRTTAYIAWHWNHKSIHLPRLQAIIAKARVAAYRAAKGFPSLSEEGSSDMEMRLEQNAAFFQQYLVEAKNRVRNYREHGLTRIRP